MTNYCIVNEDLGGLTIKLSSDNGGQSGGKFWLWKWTGDKYTPIEKKHASTEFGTGQVEIKLSTKVDEMEGCVLTWVIDTCSSIPHAENVVVKLKFYQDDKKCKATYEPRYSGTYPQCNSGKSGRNRGEIGITIISQPKTERLWTDME